MKVPTILSITLKVLFKEEMAFLPVIQDAVFTQD